MIWYNPSSSMLLCILLLIYSYIPLCGCLVWTKLLSSLYRLNTERNNPIKSLELYWIFTGEIPINFFFPGDIVYGSGLIPGKNWLAPNIACIEIFFQNGSASFSREVRNDNFNLATKNYFQENNFLYNTFYFPYIWKCMILRCAYSV